MYDSLRFGLGRWARLIGLRVRAEVEAQSRHQAFNLLRWYSVLSFIVVVAIGIGFAFTLSHFLVREILGRDAILTHQFVESIVATQNKESRLGRGVTLAQIIDQRVDFDRLGVDRKEADFVRRQFYDHLALLPDVLLSTVYAADRKIIWSTNPVLVGEFDRDNDELDEAFAKRKMVATSYLDQEHHAKEQHKAEQAFVQEPRKFFVESYLPLLDSDGAAVVVVEIYKEPTALIDLVARCHRLVWMTTALGMAFLYFAMFWIVRRADLTLENQQRQLLESEALCVVGEMSASVAHGIRNPLAAIRSSAELAFEGDLESKRKNADDIIAQVDGLGKWVRDLLVFSRPVSAEMQAIDLRSLVDECLPTFAAQLKKNGITARLVRPDGPVPLVCGNQALAAQALASVIANAIEAMPKGGSLQLEVQVGEGQRQVIVMVSDTGHGIPETQMDLIFKPFYTTKRNGLGLGMALVKRIMQRFGGAIRLDSEEGKGTHVHLVFNVESRRG